MHPATFFFSCTIRTRHDVEVAQICTTKTNTGAHRFQNADETTLPAIFGKPSDTVPTVRERNPDRAFLINHQTIGNALRAGYENRFVAERPIVVNVITIHRTAPLVRVIELFASR